MCFARYRLCAALLLGALAMGCGGGVTTKPDTPPPAPDPNMKDKKEGMRGLPPPPPPNKKAN